MIRALLDVNIYISYLLNPNGESPPIALIEAAAEQRFRLLLPSSVIEELTAVVVLKPSLAKKIAVSDVQELIDILLPNAEHIEPLDFVPDAICRDPKDDYLFAHAVLEQADYLA